jgi:hypothetical protein
MVAPLALANTTESAVVEVVASTVVPVQTAQVSLVVLAVAEAGNHQ